MIVEITVSNQITQIMMAEITQTMIAEITLIITQISPSKRFDPWRRYSSLVVPGPKNLGL